MGNQSIQEFNNILHNFDIRAQCINHKEVDNYFFYDLKLSPQTRIKDIQRYSNEISLIMRTSCKPHFKILHKEGVLRLEFINPRDKRLDLFDFLVNTEIPKGELT